MDEYDWVEVSHNIFMGYITYMTQLPCSCHLYFYFGEFKEPQAKMHRRNAKYYIDRVVLDGR